MFLNPRGYRRGKRSLASSEWLGIDSDRVGVETTVLAFGLGREETEPGGEDPC